MKLVSKYVVTLMMSCLAFYSFAGKKEVPLDIDGVTKVTADELIDLVDEHDNLVIIDSRVAKDRLGGFIEGSISLTDVDTTPESLAKVLATKNTPVIFYCNGSKCARSMNAAKIAYKEQYSKIYWFRGGWEEWTDKGTQ